MKKLFALIMIVLGTVTMNFSYADGRDSLVKNPPYVIASDKKGEYHARPNGTPLYKARFKHVGEFQIVGNDTLAWVEDFEGKFHYINPRAKAVRPQKYDYAGDFTNGYAIVEDMNGNYFHVNAKVTRAYPENYQSVENYVKVNDTTEIAWVQDANDGKYYLIYGNGKRFCGKSYDSITDFARDSIDGNYKSTAECGNTTTIITINKEGEAEIIIQIPPGK